MGRYTLGSKSNTFFYLLFNSQLFILWQISDMVAVARILNATLIIPELDKKSFWHDRSNFSDVFDEEHFINSLANDVKVEKKLPKELVKAPKSVRYFKSWSGVDYYQDEISPLWDHRQVIRAAKSDSRLANNYLPADIQKLRCRAFFQALRFAPPIEALGKLLVERMRSFGPYIALHLRYEKDMLAFSGCTYGLSQTESEELAMIRENTTYWKVKDIDPLEQRSHGYCPLTPKEVGMFLSAFGYPSSTPVYIAAGEIYGGESHMVDLQSRFPILMNKEKLASAEELRPFSQYAAQMAALDYIVSVESDVFIPSYSGNMARAVAGHRRFLGHRKTISPDRKALVRLFDKVDSGLLKEGKKLSERILDMHRKRYQTKRLIMSTTRQLSELVVLSLIFFGSSDKALRGNEKVQSREQRAKTGFGQKRHFMRILFPTACVNQGLQTAMILLSASKPWSRSSLLIPVATPV